MFGAAVRALINPQDVQLRYSTLFFREFRAFWRMFNDKTRILARFHLHSIDGGVALAIAFCLIIFLFWLSLKRLMSLRLLFWRILNSSSE